MRNKRQTAIGVGSNVRRVLEGELQKKLEAVQAEAKALRESFGLTLQRYACHIVSCPWSEPSPQSPCTCGLHDLVARLLPQNRLCEHCTHPIGYHIRTSNNKTYCIGIGPGAACACATDPSPNVAMLDAVLGRREHPAVTREVR